MNRNSAILQGQKNSDSGLVKIQTLKELKYIGMTAQYKPTSKRFSVGVWTGYKKNLGKLMANMSSPLSIFEIF